MACLNAAAAVAVTAAAAAALAQRMALPQTACLALSGPLVVPETDGGRMWLNTFEADGELIKVCTCVTTHSGLGLVCFWLRWGGPI